MLLSDSEPLPGREKGIPGPLMSSQIVVGWLSVRLDANLLFNTDPNTRLRKLSYSFWI